MKSRGSERSRVAPTMQLASGRIGLSTLRATPCTTHPHTPLPCHLTKSRLALQCYFSHTFTIKTVAQFIPHFEAEKGIPIFFHLAQYIPHFEVEKGIPIFFHIAFFFFLGKMIDPGVLAHLHAGHHQFKCPNTQVGAG